MTDQPIVSGFTRRNEIRLIRGGKEYFAVLEEMIASSSQSFYLQTYILTDDETGNRILAELMRAAHRGVAVYLLVDAFASKDLGSKAIQDLLSAGVNFRWFGPAWKNKYFYVGRRLHHKVAVADHATCLIGGLNISDRYNDLPGSSAWLDWAILVRGEVAQQAQVICEQRAKARWPRWARKPQPAGSLTPVDTETKARIRVNDWVLGKRQITLSYLRMLRSSQQEVIIMSSYFMPGNEFRRALRLAARRGVRIHVVLAGVSDIPLAKYAERFLYRWLLRHGIRIYEYNKNVLHGKLAICDDAWLTVGSYNINNLSALASIEMNVEVIDSPLAQAAKAQVMRIITEDCTERTHDAERKGSLLTRWTQVLSYYLCRILLFSFTFYFKKQE